jgi:hypothetical protein
VGVEKRRQENFVSPASRRLLSSSSFGSTNPKLTPLPTTSIGWASGGDKIGRNEKRADSRSTLNYWCERGDSNPHGFTRQILSLVRLPIPPLSHDYAGVCDQLRRSTPAITSLDGKMCWLQRHLLDWLLGGDHISSLYFSRYELRRCCLRHLFTVMQDSQPIRQFLKFARLEQVLRIPWAPR